MSHAAKIANSLNYLLILLAIAAAGAQDLPPVSVTSDYARPHLGLSTPKLLHSVDPEYTPQAIAAGIEGSVVLHAVISADGRVTNADVLSPLPAGLDRKAIAAVKQWQYSPGVMDGERVPVLTTIDVLFKLPEGEHRTNPPNGFVSQKFVSQKEAAYLGDPNAQKAIADQAESAGKLNDARWYFRMCAARGDQVCEFRLGRLLVHGTNPGDFTQGVAWLELAKEHGNPDAAKLWQESVSKLSTFQLEWVASLKPHLELRNFRGF